MIKLPAFTMHKSQKHIPIYTPAILHVFPIHIVEKRLTSDIINKHHNITGQNNVEKVWRKLELFSFEKTCYSDFHTNLY